MKKSLFLIIMVLSFCSCSEVSNIDDIVIDDGAITLSVDNESLEFSAEGGQMLLGIKSNGNWGISRSGSWFTVQTVTGKGNGNAVVEATPNTTTEVRSGTITVYNNNKSITVNVTQKASEKSGIPGSGDNNPPSV